MIVIQNRKRNLAIEMLKFVSVFLILNGHMYNLYTHFDILATGGTIGNALFMFASGYTLLLGRFDRFDNWYKRRINRIYPSLIVWIAILTVVKSSSYGVVDTIIGGGKWFISCIMIYYAVLYFVRYLLPNYKWHVFILSCIIACLWYVFLEDNKDGFFMYRDTYFKYFYWFPFMLLGAYMGAGYIKTEQKLKWDAVMTVICLLAHYIVMLICVYIPKYCFLQPLSLLPLFGLTYYLFKVFSNPKITAKVEQSKLYGFILLIASLCLEIYIVQENLFTTRFNDLFPLNLLINVVYVILVAYAVRCLGRVFKQIWREDGFDWKAVVR